VFISVSMYPGATIVSKVSAEFYTTVCFFQPLVKFPLNIYLLAFTVIPLEVHSLDNAFVSCATAPFDAA